MSSVPSVLQGEGGGLLMYLFVCKNTVVSFKVCVKLEDINIYTN